MSQQTFQELTGFSPTILGKHFRIGDDPSIYWVGGIKGKTHEIVLQSIATEEVRIISTADFKRLAIPAHK